MLAAIKADYFDNLVDTAKFTIELDSVDLVFDDNLTVIEEGGVEMVEICMIGKVVTAEADFSGFVDVLLDEGREIILEGTPEFEELQDNCGFGYADLECGENQEPVKV